MKCPPNCPACVHSFTDETEAVLWVLWVQAEKGARARQRLQMIVGEARVLCARRRNGKPVTGVLHVASTRTPIIVDTSRIIRAGEGVMLDQLATVYVEHPNAMSETPFAKKWMTGHDGARSDWSR
jgi:hypothetical protein